MTPDHPLEPIKILFYDRRPVVYLIHLATPLKHARHYVGSSTNLIERMRCYRAGNADASAFMRAVHRAGLAWTLARVWTFDTEREARDFEYHFKKGAMARTAAAMKARRARLAAQAAP